MKLSKTFALVLALSAGPLSADELLSGPYHFDGSSAVHAKPAMLAGGWGMTTGVAFETVINGTVTTGGEVNFDIPVVPYPGDSGDQVAPVYGGFRLGALVASDAVLHGFVNNTIGVGLLAGQTFLINETSVAAELNVTKAIRLFAGTGYRFVYGVNEDRGVSDANLRGLYFDVGLRFGEIER